MCLVAACTRLTSQISGKKNLVVSQDLAGPISLFVKFSTLQDYGVDSVFLLENSNVDSSQKNIIFLIRAEKPLQVQKAAGKQTTTSMGHNSRLLR